VRVVLGQRLHNGWAIEGAYLGLFDAATSAYVAAPPEDPDVFTALAFPGGLGATNVFSDMDQVWVNYSSALHSAELNLVGCQGGCNTCDHGNGEDAAKSNFGTRDWPCRSFEWLAGFRYLNLSERLHIYAERFQDDTGLESGVYDIRTSNNLFGVQLGTRLRRWGDRWGCEAAGKAGLFGNAAQEEQYVLDWDQGGSFEKRPLTSDAGGQVAFVGELNLTGIYRLTDAWNLRAGYNLIWITGTALAPDQLDFSGTLPAGNQLSSSGNVFLHGVSAGLEARW
jgi:hypothetical protein